MTANQHDLGARILRLESDLKSANYDLFHAVAERDTLTQQLVEYHRMAESGVWISRDEALALGEIKFIAQALADAAKAVKVLMTMLAKTGLKQGFAVADEILGNIQTARKHVGHLGSTSTSQPEQS